MSNKPFIYQAPFPMGKDNTEYYLLTSDYVSVADFDGETVLKVEPEALTCWRSKPFTTLLSCSARHTRNRLRLFFTIQKPAKTTSTWRCNS